MSTYRSSFKFFPTVFAFIHIDFYINNKLVKSAGKGDIIKIKVNDTVSVDDLVVITTDKEISDEINNIDWERLLPGSEAYETMMYYKGLIELRKNSSVLTSQGKTLITFGNLAKGGMTVLFEYDDKSILALINPTKDSDTYTLDAEWNVLADGIKVGAETIENVSGEVDVLPQSVMIFAK